MHAALAELRALGARFLVAGRLTPAGFQTADDLPALASFGELFTRMPEARFRAGVFSTALRRAPQGDLD